jgi:hypothetical protein
LRLAELQEAVGLAQISVRNQSISRQITAAMEVFNDLDILRRLFNSSVYFLIRDVRVSDIFPIVRKYNIRYQENRIAKVTVYDSMMPFRRTHIDALAALIGNAPPDNNPTLTCTEAAVAADDLTWSFVDRQKDGYNWYLGRYPQGRHAAEARSLIGRQGEIREAQEAELAKIRDELSSITHKVFEAYVRGDRAAFERLLGGNFPSRALYIARLRAQPNVRSFEIQNFEVRPSPIDPESYRIKVNVQYRSLSDEKREYHNTITYRRVQGSWQIIEWRSP